MQSTTAGNIDDAMVQLSILPNFVNNVLLLQPLQLFFQREKFGPSQSIKLSKKFKLTNIKIASNSFNKPH